VFLIIYTAVTVYLSFVGGYIFDGVLFMGKLFVIIISVFTVRLEVFLLVFLTLFHPLTVAYERVFIPATLISRTYIFCS